MRNAALDMVKFQTTETQLENYIETLRNTVSILNSRINELQETLSQVRGKISQIKREDVSMAKYLGIDNIGNTARR